MPETLVKLVDRVRKNPASAESLSLYALVCTLKMEKGGHMYMLRKLRELTPEGRLLAYDLMELMAEKKNAGEAWDNTIGLLDNLIRGR
ncbi:MAG: hypothetical protein V3V12_00260 [Gammaproteobacteria bacterium]